MFEASAAAFCLFCRWLSRSTLRRVQGLLPPFLFAVISIVCINVGFIVHFNERSRSDFVSSVTELLSVNFGLCAVVIGATFGLILLRVVPPACLALAVINIVFSVISGTIFFINAVVACLFVLLVVRLTGLLFGRAGPGDVTSWSTAGLDAGTIRGRGHPLESH